MAHKGEKFPAEVLTKAEVEAILGSFPKSKTGVRNRALIAVYLYSQLRCNECLDLRPTDISRDLCTVTVLRGKGGKRRVAGIPGEILDTFVQAWLDIRPASAYLFCTHKGQRLHDSYIRHMLKRHAEKAGIRHRVHVHGLRHSGAFHLAQAGADIRHIQKQLGHSSLAVTDRYLAHLGADEAPRAIAEVKW